MEWVVRKKGALLTVALLLSFIISFSCFGLWNGETVLADGGVSAGISYVHYDDPGTASVYISPWGYNNGDIINVTMNFSDTVWADSTGDISVISDGGSVVVRFTYDGETKYMYVHAGDMSTVVMTSSSSSLYQAATPPTTAAPTTEATTAAPTTEATTAAPTTEATTAATETTTAATTTTASEETSESTDESTDESSEETTEETSEETTANLDNPALVPGVGGSKEQTAVEEESEATPTPTEIPVVVGTTRVKNNGGFPWWLLAVTILIIGSMIRYSILKKKDYYGKELAYEFIPGRLIGNIADKISPPKAPAPAPAVTQEQPRVINGYLQTSNTRSIRPEFSNAAALAKMESKAAPQANTIPGMKPPVKRAASASVNHAAAMKELADAKAEKAPAPKAAPTEKPAVNNAPPPGLKPPIKRAASASVNHAALAAEAAKEEAAKADVAKTDVPKATEAKSQPAEDIRKPVEAEAPVVHRRTPFAKQAGSAAVRKTGAETDVSRDIMKNDSRANKEMSENMNQRRSRSAMNRPDGSGLHANAGPTVAAMAFEKAMSEKGEKPSIATQFVPPVIEKNAEAPRPSPFKQIKRPDGADVGAAAESVAKENKEKAPNIALNFIPMPVAEKKTISPFKSNAEKGPIKRPASASVNRAAALKAEQAEGPEKHEPEAEEEKYNRPSFTAALAEHQRATSFRPSNEFGSHEKIDPFKHNVDSEGNAIPTAPLDDNDTGLGAEAN